jgi:hypothetical protein
MPQLFKELFFSDPRVQLDDAGLLWKPVLRTGEWKTGPNGRPLVVIPGRSPDQMKAIGMQDIVDNFDKIEHVTIPLSHDDRLDENQGFVRRLKIHKADDGTSYLMAAHDFTEPDAKEKVQRGTWPNTSVGLEFDYQHKETGAKIPVVLKHVALTHRPWINRLTPFGVTASEDIDYTVSSVEFSEAKTDDQLAHFDITAWSGGALKPEQIRAKIAESLGADHTILDVAHNRALVKNGDKQFIVNYSVADGNVAVDPKDSWQEHSSPAPSSPAPTPTPDNIIPTVPPKEPTAVTPTETPEVKALREQLAAAEADRQRMATQLSEQANQLTTLSEKDKKRDAEEWLSDLRGMGLSEENGCTAFLVKVRNFAISDEGKAVINFSEDGRDAAPVPMTVTQALKALLSELPTDDKTGALKLGLSTIATDPLNVSGSTKPPVNDPNEVKLAEGTREFEEDQDEVFAAMFNRPPVTAGA